MSIRKQYDTDLESLKNSLSEMGRNAADAVEAALEALCTADAEVAKAVVKGDSRINNMERDIEHRCMTLLLRQQPVAGDLRRFSTAMKVVTGGEPGHPHGTESPPDASGCTCRPDRRGRDRRPQGDRGRR